MKLRSLFLGLFSLLSLGIYAQNPIPELKKLDNGRHTLFVDGEPFFVLGGQCGNSSNWPSQLPEVWKTMNEMHANTLEIPVYWEVVEPEQGKYDFSSVQLLLDQARQQDMRLVLLWFATWKNGSNHYMPQWMKLQSERFFNVVGKTGKQIDSPSAHCTEAMELDKKAFVEFMKYLKKHDTQHTVIMVQVQNEPGTWDSVRDYSKSLDKVFNSPVPEALLKPSVMKELETKAKKGTWPEVFGDRADEYFNAWHIARYIEEVAAAGKAVNPLPLYVNVALREPFGNPPATNYESGGATDNVIAIYKAAAPHIDFVAPDIYLNGDAKYMKVLELYNRPDNALMVPETRDNPKYLYEVVANGIGFSPFGVDGKTHEPLAAEYKLLKPVSRQLAQWQSEGRIYTSIQKEGQKADTALVDMGNWAAKLIYGQVSRNITTTAENTPEGHAMLIKLAEGEFYAMGTNVRFTFEPQGKDKGKAWHYLVVEEGCFNEKGEWHASRILNGDETDWGGTAVGATPAMLHIKVYVRERRN